MGIEELLLDRAKNEGIEKGTKTGIKLERAKAEREKKEIAGEMKKEGLSIAQIVKFTKLSIKEIEQL